MVRCQQNTFLLRLMVYGRSQKKLTFVIIITLLLQIDLRCGYQ